MHQAPPTPPPTASRNDKKKETGGHMLLLWAQETLGQNLTINERLYQQGMVCLKTHSFDLEVNKK